MNTISVITVTFNSERTINDCLESLMKYAPESQVIVVDNGSTDKTLKLVGKFKRVKLVQAKDNLGYAKANNLGAKEATRDHLVFLNPDAMLTSLNSLEYLQQAMKQNSQYGILGPKLIYPDGSIQERVRNLPTIARAFKEYILGMEGVYSFLNPESTGLCEVESVIGACLMIRKELFIKVGGFDERYFMYYEDLQLCKEVRNLGYKVGFVPEVIVIHTEGVSGKNQKTRELMEVSARRYFGLPAYFLLQIIFFYNRMANKIRQISGRKLHA